MTATLQPTAPPVVAPTGWGRLRLVLVLGALIALGPLTIDMYLPALPTIVDDLETTSAAVQLTLTGTLVGLALGQLLVGPLSDTFGRRRPLLVGVGVHVLASLLILVAPNVAVLGGLRVLQGVGAAAASVVTMAIVRDLFVGRAAATLFSRLMLVLGVAPVLAPTIGGEVLRFTSWRGVFVVLAVMALMLVVVAAVALPETLPPARRRPLGVRTTLRTYRGLLRDRTFVGLVLVAGLAMSGLFGYVAGSSFVFQEEFGLDQQQFGLLFGAGALFLIGATQLNAALLRRFEPRVLLPFGLVLATVAGAVLLVLAGDRHRRHRRRGGAAVDGAVRRRPRDAERAHAGAGPARRGRGHGLRAARRDPDGRRRDRVAAGRRARQRRRRDGRGDDGRRGRRAGRAAHRGPAVDARGPRGLTREPRQERLRERADRQRVGDGADADGAAEQPAGGEHGQLDPGADQPDRPAGPRGQAGHQPVARAGAEPGADVGRGGDAVEHDPADQQGHPGRAGRRAPGSARARRRR